MDCSLKLLLLLLLIDFIVHFIRAKNVPKKTDVLSISYLIYNIYLSSKNQNLN